MIFKKAHLVLLAICFFYLLPLLAQAQTKEINLVGEYIPGATNSDGTGFQFELVKAIFEPLGYQVNINVYPYKRALIRVEAGQDDMMVGMIKQQNMSLAFSQVPHEADKILAIFIKKNNETWQGVKSLKNKKLVMLSSIIENVKKNPYVNKNQMIEVSKPAQALKMLRHNRADFIIMTESEYNLNYTAISPLSLSSKPIGYLEIYAAFTDSVKAKKIKTIWDDHFLPYFNSKAAKAMYKRWGVSKNYQTTLNYLAK